MLCQFLDHVGFLHQLEYVSIFAVLPWFALSISYEFLAENTDAKVCNRHIGTFNATTRLLAYYGLPQLVR